MATGGAVTFVFTTRQDRESLETILLPEILPNVVKRANREDARKEFPVSRPMKRHTLECTDDSQTALLAGP